MAVFRIEKTKDYTIMSNHHLRNQTLSLKAKGLLSQMLSLPEDWDYTLAGLCHINRESKDAIRTALQELEKAGYIIRERERDDQGRLRGADYIIREYPITMPVPASDMPASDMPASVLPTSENPTLENPTQLNKDILNKDISSKDIQNTDISFLSFPKPERREKKEAISEETMKVYREVIAENIAYDLLRTQMDTEDLDEIVELMVETVCTNRETIRVAGSDLPREMIKSRLLKINDDHIRFVTRCMRENTTKIRNIKQYLLTALYNAPVTISNYHGVLLNYEMHNGQSGVQRCV